MDTRRHFANDHSLQPIPKAELEQRLRNESYERGERVVLDPFIPRVSPFLRVWDRIVLHSETGGAGDAPEVEMDASDPMLC